MRLSKPQKRVLLMLLEYDCVVHIIVPIRADYEHAFYGGLTYPRPRNRCDTVRPATIHALRKKGLLEKVEGLYGSKPGDTFFSYGREGKYSLTDLGKQIAEELREKQDAKTD